MELKPTHLSYRHLLSMAWPFIVANASVPLLGIVDTAVIGNTGSVVDLGAIALGALIFSFVYWSFGFLRMGTTGFIARADGAGDKTEVRAIFGRSCLIAVAVGLLLLILQWPIGLLSFQLLSGDESVEVVAQSYFYTRIWGAPATLMIFVIMGVWIGLGQARELLKLQLFLNGLNMVLDILAAGVLGLGAVGIAGGTVVAEVITCGLGFYRLKRFLVESHAVAPEWRMFWPTKRLRQYSQLLALLSANTDIMVRTLLLVFAFSFFTNEAAKFGVVALAATHIVLQIMAFTAFFLDGFAYVAESLSGRSYGAKDKATFSRVLRRTTQLAALAAIGLSGLVLLTGEALISALTNLEEVVALSTTLLPVCAAYVLASFPAFQLDGLFIGTSRTREMRNASLGSTVVFLCAIAWLGSYFGLMGLWWAMVVFVLVRAVSLWLYFPAVMKHFTSEGERRL
ncbi:MATE family efflux transporter [Luminiphilus sp.]|nr:MATE family efflux transporter [Luminiphilus sp.]MDB3899258.1 MATE family efflux transporter [Luminiphilus sp.]